ncbi:MULTISPECIES: LysR family transcriptional regulator [Streptomyces]|uniref:LysR family transcriptional regulator n=1 Tax=Streptomyces TaxID=1883 RepID=UPI00163C1BBD|nr:MULTISPECIES: LysR family transcriptional regulator [Streptomyces]MBC2874679.1 LysR family transcriptional regulator [Streptomyces sp. TYQ1024]UBI36557.1 LysR family transcriptional regulator [Streptomyces mobaraensis]UKW29148.1 LysR substrate-binding domain-containing protein [Streptomyces sp. TYQ1024]
MDLDLRQTRYAVTLAEELHYGRAAARLAIAQQTLSAQITALEKRLGVRLFHRDRRQVGLTPEGEVFVPRARRLLGDARQLVDDLARTPTPLRVDVLTEGLTPSVLARHLRAQNPCLPFEVVHSQGLAAALPRLLSGELDLAFGRVHGHGHGVGHGVGHGRELPAPLAVMPVRLEPIGVIVPAGHPLAAYEEVPLAALADHPLLVHTADEAAEWRDWIDRIMEDFGLRSALRVRGHGRAAIHAMVQARGYPSFGLTTGHLPDGLTARRLADPVPLYPWHAVWNTTTAPTATHRALEIIHAYAQAHHWHRLPDAPWWLPETDRAALSPRK